MPVFILYDDVGFYCIYIIFIVSLPLESAHCSCAHLWMAVSGVCCLGETLST